MTPTKKLNPLILVLSIPLSGLIIFSSWVGLFSDDFYALETFNWQTQSIGQDMVNLFLIVPILIITSFFAYRNNDISILLWGGTLLYLIYTFVIFSFNIHFNKLFLVYSVILGLSVYSFLYFAYLQAKSITMKRFQKNGMTQVIAIYFIVIAGLFYFLWLSEIVPSILNDKVPGSLSDVGLFTNPVHVLDLSVFLPGIFLVGMLLMRGNTVGSILTPVVLTFFILMDLTIAFLTFLMSQRGIEVNLSVAFIMVGLALLSLFFLLRYINIIIKGGMVITNKAAMQKA